ncbi:MAG: DUF4040 domain-containing protein [Xenococcaceae cyanobacterium MO_167.B52]|nr:DUF4040 domain-containing protein [Xenococcaceae cyanobacterium MO_167.B52]
MTDNYVYIIVALLPITALMSVLQVNPYNALIIRGILGAVSVMIYAVLGAADVALTEALVGTMLGVALYVIAVRSSFVMRLGIVEPKLEPEPKLELELALAIKQRKIRESEELHENFSFIRQTLFRDFEIEPKTYLPEVIDGIRKIVKKHYLRLELVKYPNSEMLEEALACEEVHAICTRQENHSNGSTVLSDRISVRVHRLFEILQSQLNIPDSIIEYKAGSNKEEKH